MKHNYMDEETRQRRAEGVDELVEMANDMGDLEKMADALRCPARRKFKKELKRNFYELTEQDFHLVYECLHEAYNCAYETAVEYQKGLRWVDYLRFWGQR